jgi:hypothetical protein
VTLRAKAFLVRTADGGHAKLQITSDVDGTLGFDWADAGAGRDDFQVAGGIVTIAKRQPSFFICCVR